MAQVRIPWLSQLVRQTSWYEKCHIFRRSANGNRGLRGQDRALRAPAPDPRRESFVITQRGTPVAELRPIENTSKRESRWGDMATKRGDMKGKIWIADDFCEPIEEMREYME